jgi:hypothetical protein
MRLIASVVGGLLILVGLILPSSTLIRLLNPERIQDALLLQGAMLFRIGLLLNGLAFILAGRMLAPAGDEPQAGQREQHSPHTVLALGGILAAALILRLLRLDQGIWVDEIIAWVNYMHLSLGEVVTTYDDPNNHLLFTLLARASFLLFGESIWALRLPAVLLGVAGIWALYLFAASVASRREALLAAAFLAVSYHHLWFSQNARGYTGILLWTLLSSWLLVRALGEQRRSLWLLYAICAALGAYTHMSMVFIVGGHLIIALVSSWRRRADPRPPDWAGMIGGFVLVGLFAFQLHALVLPQAFSGALFKGVKGSVASWMNPIWSLLEILRSVKIGFGSLPALAALLLFTVGSVSFARTQPLVLWLLFVPTVMAGAVMLALRYTLFPRFFFFDLGFGVVLLIRGAMRCGEFAVNRLRPGSSYATAAGTALCIGMCVASAWTLPVAYLPKQDFAGALAFVEESRRAGDAVVAVGVARMPYEAYFRPGWRYPATAGELESIRAGAPRTWLVYTLETHLREASPEIMSAIERNFEVAREFYGTLGGGTVVVCRSRDGGDGEGRDSRLNPPPRGS